MVQSRAKQRGLNQEALNKLTPEELLQTYFENGGFMTKDGFGQTAPISRETSAVCSSLSGLLRTNDGHRLLIKTLDDFHEGKIDKDGKLIKKIKVLPKKPTGKKHKKQEKRRKSPPSRKASASAKALADKSEGKGGKSGKARSKTSK
ncbi:MAG: hypothetical protein NT116_04130 [Candidatus Parcubacteria bacterium]|nr:hypothetical protein [Candidatus Parcubacteria bacterium]